MYNRLKQNEKLLVDDTLSLLTTIRTKLISQSAEVTEIDSEIAKLCKQNDMYVQLRNKKIMDEVSQTKNKYKICNPFNYILCAKCWCYRTSND